MVSHGTGRIHVAGAVCFACALLGTVISGYLAWASRAVAPEPFGYLQALPGVTALQMVLALSRVGLIFGLLSLWWSGLVATPAALG